jgi:hypothetical protein
MLKRLYLCLDSVTEDDKPTKEDMYENGWKAESYCPKHAALMYMVELWHFLDDVPKRKIIWVMDSHIRDEKLYEVEVTITGREAKFD